MLQCPSTDSGSFDQLCDRLFHEDDGAWWMDEREHPQTETWHSFPSQGRATGTTSSREFATPELCGARRQEAATLTSPRPRGHSAHRSIKPAPDPSAAREKEPSGSWRRKLGWASLLTAFFAAMLCMIQGWRASDDAAIPIAEIEIGQKVIMAASPNALSAAERDLPEQYARNEGRIDPASWKRVRLRSRAYWDDGTLDEIRVETLQPPEWLDAMGIRAGTCIPMPLEFIDVELPGNLQADVLSVDPCPPIEDGPGRVVQTTVSHLNADVHELTVESEDGRRETFRPTGGHKMYRANGNQWVPAADLRPGDVLQGTDGPLTVVNNQQLPGVHRVYNLTVEGEHVYHVSSLGALTHNSLSCLKTKRPKGLTNPGRTGKQARLRELANHPNTSKVDRGWINNEMRHIRTGNRKTIRLPGNSRNSRSGGKVLAHKRGMRAADGHSYKESVLQDTDLHTLEHKFEGY